MNIESVAATIVGTAAAFLVLLGIVGLAKPALAKSFFGGFVASLSRHYLEIAIRILVGAAMIVHASSSATPSALQALGWILIGTSIVLALIPWRWHKEFAQKSVPRAMRYLSLLAGACIVLGLALFLAAFTGAVGKST